MIKRFVKSLPVFVLIFLVFLTVKNLLQPGYFPMHDDMQAMRLLQIEKCVLDWQIPCRWVPDMGYGYGYPQFNYYSPMPYYFMLLFRFIGFGYLASVKLFFVFIAFASGIGMYLFGKKLWGPWGGFVSGVLYTYAPYRAVDLYVRGAVGELAAFAIIPFIFLFTKNVLEGDRKSRIWLVVSLSLLFTSHNISIIMVLPNLLVWVLYQVYTKKLFTLPLFVEKTKFFLISFLWAFLLAAFFLIPAFLEKKYVHIDSITQGYFNYTSHFIGIKELLFSTYWGYGSSQGGPNDQLLLSPGILLWGISLLTLLLSLFTKNKNAKHVVFFVICGWISLFLIHPKSLFLWENLPLLSYFQFPWRFLLIATFAFSIAGGAIVDLFKESSFGRAFAVISVTVFTLLFYFYYFRPAAWLKINDEAKFSGESWYLQQTVSINDYLPIYSKNAPQSQAGAPKVVEGNAQIIAYEKGSNWAEVAVNAKVNSRIVLPIFYFPDWRVKINEDYVPISYADELGLIEFDIKAGKSVITAKLHDTPVRKFSNLVSVVGLAGVFLMIKKNEK